MRSARSIPVRAVPVRAVLAGTELAWIVLAGSGPAGVSLAPGTGPLPPLLLAPGPPLGRAGPPGLLPGAWPRRARRGGRGSGPPGRDPLVGHGLRWGSLAVPRRVGGAGRAAALAGTAAGRADLAGLRLAARRA